MPSYRVKVPSHFTMPVSQSKSHTMEDHFIISLLCNMTVGIKIDDSRIRFLKFLRGFYGYCDFISY